MDESSIIASVEYLLFMSKIEIKRKPLSTRQQLFVDLLPEHKFVVWKAGVEAGFTENYAKHRLPGLVLANVVLKQAIEVKLAEIKAKSIATREQRQQFWTEVYGNDRVNMSDRLRASELLGKSEADFVEVVEQKGKGLTINVGESPAEYPKLAKEAG